MNHITMLNPNELGDFAPMFAGALEKGIDGFPILLGYKKENTVMGALAAVQIDDVILLRWLVVEEEFRRQGIGSQLIDILCQYAAVKKIREIGSVICLSEKEQAIAENLLMKNGFQMTEQNKMFSMPLSSIKEGALASYIKKARHANITALSNILNVQWQEFNRRILSEEGFSLVDAVGLLKDCSFCWIENGKITGCILVVSCDKDIEIQWLYGQKPLAVQEMIMAAAAALVDKYSEETRIYATAMLPSVESMIRKLAGDKLKEEQSVDFYQRLF